MNPLIRRSDLTDPPRYYLLTRYAIKGNTIIASKKYDVTDDINEILFEAALEKSAADDLLAEVSADWEVGPGPFVVPMEVVNKVVNYLHKINEP